MKNCSRDITKGHNIILGRRSFTSIRVIAVIFVLVVVLIALWFSRSFFVKPKPVIDYVAKYNEISKPKDLDPNENAWPDLELAFKNLIDMPNDLKPVYQLWPKDMNEAQLKLAADWLSQNEQTIPLLTLAAAKQYSWHPVESKSKHLGDIYMLELRNYRTCAQLLTVKAKFLAVDNDMSASFESLQNAYKIGSFLSGPKVLIEQLVGIAVRSAAVNAAVEVVYYTNPSEQTLADFQKAISQIKSEYPSTVNFQSERLLFLDELQRGFDDPKSIWAMMKNIKSVYDVDSNNITKESTLEVYEEAYAYINGILNKTPFELEELRAEEKLNEIRKKNNFVGLTFPAFLQVIKNFHKTAANTDALIVILALQRYKIKTGNYPDSLSVLQQDGYIDKIPVDPFSPNPLVYRKTSDSFILYGCAEDFDDDDGKHVDKKAFTGDGDLVFWPVQENKVKE